MKTKDDEPFVFPSQVQQVFYYENPNHSKWKVVLQKEPRSIRMVSDKNENIVAPFHNLLSKEAPLEILEVPRHMTLVNQIELSKMDAFLVVEAL